MYCLAAKSSIKKFDNSETFGNRIGNNNNELCQYHRKETTGEEIRRKWAEIVSADNSTVDKTDKFPSLLKFLRSQRGAIEYDTASLWY